MKTLLRSAFLVLGLAITFTVTATALAGVTGPVLANWAFNLNGAVYESPLGPPSPKDAPPTIPAPPGSFPGPLPGYVDTSGFNFFTGFGTIGMTINTLGANNIIAFFDRDIDPYLFYFDSAATNGAPVAGQSWEIDNPVSGDIYSHVVAGSLDNTSTIAGPGDVSMAMGWNFVLGAGEIASLVFSVQPQVPAGIELFNGVPAPGISLVQFLSNDGVEAITFSSTLDIRTAEPIPEPATLLLLGTGLAGVGAIRRKRAKKT